MQSELTDIQRRETHLSIQLNEKAQVCSTWQPVLFRTHKVRGALMLASVIAAHFPAQYHVDVIDEGVCRRRLRLRTELG